MAAQARGGGLTPGEIAAALRDRAPVGDDDFDALYAAVDRRRSGAHWTPVVVALEASRMLADCPGGRVLDVGSGGGKMCAIGALSSPLHWTGVERDPRLVRAAARIVRDLGVADRVELVEGDALALDWSEYGGIYMYNPFAEAVFAAAETEDEGQGAYGDAIEAVEAKLALLRPGARVVTLFGFGGDVPDCFQCVERVPIHGDTLCSWIRR